jgi:1-phosphofructokinase
MRIVTLTLNPAIDQTVRVDNFRPNTVNKAHSMQLDAGGKGVNVASILADYGCDVAVTGFLGADNTLLFEQLFAKKGITDRFVRIPGRTRTNVKLVDEAKQQTTDINMPGETPSLNARQNLLLVIEELTPFYDWFVLAGNLPPEVPSSIYVTLINQLKKSRKSIILDTSRDALQKGVMAGPTIIKPNLDELQQLVGYPLSTQERCKRQQSSYSVMVSSWSLFQWANGGLYL